MPLAQRSPAAARPQHATAAPMPRPAGQQFRTPPAGYRPNGVAPMGHRPVTEQPAARAAVTFLTVAEVAAVMRVSKMTVYRLVHGGEMAAVRVGRSFRVPAAAVRAYLDDARTDLA